MSARMVFISPVRGADTTAPGVSGTFHSILTAANSNSIPVTFAVRYDTLVDPTFATDLASLAGSGHEAGAWFEIMPAHCTAAGVTYNTNGTDWFGACRCLLLGYSQSDRKKLIDTHMAAHLTVFGRYPTSIHAWMIDSYSALYCRDTYGVRVVSLCRDQWATDGYELQGGPQNTIWEPSPDWLMVPCDTVHRTGLAVLRSISVDLLWNYGNPASSGKVYTLEPVAVSVDSKTIAGYWTPLVADQLAHPASTPFGPIAAAFMEDGFAWATYGSFTSAAFAEMATLHTAGTVQLQTASQLGEDFFATNILVRDYPRYLQQTVDPFYGSLDRCLEVTYPCYKARFHLRSDGSSGTAYLSDLRTYAGAVDPYQNTVCNTQVGVWQVPWCLDGGNYSYTSKRASQDTYPNSPICCRWDAIDPPGSVISDASGSGDIAITAIPERAGDGLFWTREGGASSAGIEFLPRGMIWSAARTAAGSTSKLWLDYGIEAADDPLVEYISVSGTENSLHATSNTSTLTEDTDVDYLVLTWDGRDAAVILFPLAVTGGSIYGATATGLGVRLGVEASGAGPISAIVAVVPTTKSYWRSVLAALQTNVFDYLRGE